MVELIKVEHAYQLETLFVKDFDTCQSADEHLSFFVVMIKGIQQGFMAYCRETQQTLCSVITDKSYERQANELLLQICR